MPTVSTESTFITATIAASEGRQVRCYDVPSVFVNTDVDEDMITVLKGELADMMIQIAPEIYRKYITVNRKGTRILCCETSEGAVQTDVGQLAVLSEIEERV